MELHIYSDIGLVPGELNAKDTIIAVNTEYNLSDGPFVTYFQPRTTGVLVVAQTMAGCFDQIIHAQNLEVQMGTLPMKLKMFTGKRNLDKNQLDWVVASNESGRHFELQKSSDGKKFETIGTVPASSKIGEAYYTYKDKTQGSHYYKLKIVNADKSSFYSPVLFIEQSENVEPDLSLLQNPVHSILPFQFKAGEADVCTITLYNTSGLQVAGTQVNALKGANQLSMNLDQKLARGMYILEVRIKGQRSVERFVKQ